MNVQTKWFIGGFASGVLVLYLYNKYKTPIAENIGAKQETILNPVNTGIDPQGLVNQATTITDKWWESRKPSKLGITKEIVTGNNEGIPAMELGQYAGKVKLLDIEYEKNIAALTEQALKAGYELVRKDNPTPTVGRNANAANILTSPPTFTIKKV